MATNSLVNSNEYINFTPEGHVTDYKGELADSLKALSRQALVHKVYAFAAGVLYLVSLVPLFHPGVHSMIDYLFAGGASVYAVFSLRDAYNAHSIAKQCVNTVAQNIAEDLEMEKVDLSALEYSWEDFKQEVEKSIFLKA